MTDVFTQAIKADIRLNCQLLKGILSIGGLDSLISSVSQRSWEGFEGAWGREGQCCQWTPQVGNIAFARILTCLFTEGIHQGGSILFCTLSSQPVSERLPLVRLYRQVWQGHLHREGRVTIDPNHLKLLFMYIFLYMAGEIESGMKLKTNFYCECLQAEE